jgi:hypothetical protein
LKKEFSLVFKPHIIGASKQLTVSDQFIQLKAAGKDDKGTRLDKQDIVAYRFGVKWINGYKFTIGREYQIFVKDSFGCVLKIGFKSLYGYKRNELYAQYNDVMKAIWDNHLSDLATNYLQQVSSGETIRICGVEITQTTVTIEARKILNKKKVTLPWELVGTKDYATYYAIFSTENPAEENSTYNYLDDWNAGILYSVIETLKKHFSESSGLPADNQDEHGA